MPVPATAQRTAMQPKFSEAIKTAKYQNMIMSTLNDRKKADRFTGAIMSAVAVNPELAKCEPWSILTGALTGETLGLSPSPQMGQYYLIPRKGQAVFQLGYKGLLNLALRSGQYKRLNAVALKPGELKRWNPLTEELEIQLIENDAVRESMESVGYVAFFEYHNGYSKTVYWSREKVEAHRKRYSRTGKVWDSNFDAMALKTVLTNLITKWGTMTIDSPVVAAIQQDPEALEMTSDMPMPEEDAAASSVPDAVVIEPEPVQQAPAAQPDVSPFGDDDGIDIDAF